MLKVFIDSDIFLDLLLKKNDYSASAALMTRIINEEFAGFTTPIVIANIHYIMSKYGGKNKSVENIRKIRSFVSILTINEEIIDEALDKNAADFEDSIQYITAEKNKMDFIVTRNIKDFKKSKVPVLSASELLILSNKRL